MDPLVFRLKNLPTTEKRLVKVFNRVAAMAKWGRELPEGVGLGIAGAIYKGESYAAVVAEVSIDATDKNLRVNKVWCAQDCGLIINPDQVENQIAGNIIWGCSLALKEQITFAAGQVEQSNFDDYEILRHNEAPEMEIGLIVSDEKPTGVGETALAPVAPAITNAIFAATGKRVRQLPINLESVFEVSETKG
jgi:CO/xanthine dehydrogenase Mo-binding subunit